VEAGGIEPLSENFARICLRTHHLDPGCAIFRGNLRRHHLSESPRAMVAARIARLNRAGEDKCGNFHNMHEPRQTQATDSTFRASLSTTPASFGAPFSKIAVLSARRLSQATARGSPGRRAKCLGG